MQTLADQILDLYKRVMSMTETDCRQELANTLDLLGVVERRLTDLERRLEREVGRERS